MRNSPAHSKGFVAKTLAIALFLVCLVLGLIGIVLPIIPGLLFLAIAALICARHSPAFARWLHRNRTMGSYLDDANRVAGLGLPQMLRYGGLMCLKLSLEGIALAAATVGKVWRALR
jgi:uncharacterized membrane protein YbaN (DUF454 family)